MQEEEDEMVMTPDHHAMGGLIGDISEGMLDCSYNEHEVMELWLSKELNNTFKNLDAWQLKKFQHLYCAADCERINPEDPFDFEKILWKLYVSCGGWPVDWLCNYTKLEDLDIDGIHREALVHLPKVTLERIAEEVWNSVGGHNPLEAATVSRIIEDHLNSGKKVPEQEPDQGIGRGLTNVQILYLP